MVDCDAALDVRQGRRRVVDSCTPVCRGRPVSTKISQGDPLHQQSDDDDKKIPGLDDVVVTVRCCDRVPQAALEQSAETLERQGRYRQALALYIRDDDRLPLQRDGCGRNDGDGDGGRENRLLLLRKAKCAAGAASCCSNLDRWDDAYRYSQHALKLCSDAMSAERPEQQRDDLTATEAQVALAVIELKIKSMLLMARALGRRHQTQESVELLRCARLALVEKQRIQRQQHYDHPPTTRQSPNNEIIGVTKAHEASRRSTSPTDTTASPRSILRRHSEQSHSTAFSDDGSSLTGEALSSTSLSSAGSGASDDDGADAAGGETAATPTRRPRRVSFSDEIESLERQAQMMKQSGLPEREARQLAMLREARSISPLPSVGTNVAQVNLEWDIYSSRRRSPTLSLSPVRSPRSVDRILDAGIFLEDSGSGLLLGPPSLQADFAPSGRRRVADPLRRRSNSGSPSRPAVAFASADEPTGSENRNVVGSESRAPNDAPKPYKNGNNETKTESAGRRTVTTLGTAALIGGVLGTMIFRGGQR